jgi:tetratricopeptide (TPR) repeat protein
MLHTDSDIKTAENFLSRGNFYAKRKMWAMAAIHFRRAALQMPDNINGHMALVLAYLNLGMHDKIWTSLDQAKRLNPDDPALHQLIEDIQGTSKI